MPRANQKRTSLGEAGGGQGSFLEEVAAGAWLLKSKGAGGNSQGQRCWPSPGALTPGCGSAGSTLL